MSFLKKLAGQTAIYGVSSILSRLLNYIILTPYLTRVFAQSEYGVVSEVYTYIALLLVLFTYRMETAYFRFSTKTEDKVQKTFSTASLSILITTLFYGSLMLLFAQPIADFLQYPNNANYIVWFTFIIMFDALSAIPFARLRLKNQPIRFAAIKTLGILVNIFFILFFLEIIPRLSEQGVTVFDFLYSENDRIAYIFIANFLGSLVSILCLLPHYFHIKLRFDKALWKKMMAYTLPLTLVGLAAVINQLISLPLLKFLLPYGLEENQAQVGVYTASMRLAILMSLFIQAFNYAAEPFFFRNAKEANAKHIYAQVGHAFAIVGSLIFLGIMLYLDLIQLILGKDFREALGVVPILLLAFLFLGLYYNFSIWYKLTDKTRIGAYISLTGAVITLALNFLLIPRIGYYGAAWASLACYAFMAIAGYWTGQKWYPIAYPIRKMVFYIGLAVLVYYCSQWGLTLLEWENLFVKLLWNTGFLLVFLGVVYWRERAVLLKKS